MFTMGTPLRGSDADPLFGMVQLLLHCDGTNGSTTMVDSSGTPKTGITANAGATISTVQSKFGGASALSSATNNSRFTVPAQAGLRVIGDFTVECWVRFNAIGTQYFIDSYDVGSSWIWLYLETGKLNAYVFGITILSGGTGPTLVTNTWYHLAVTRAGTVRSLWLDGVLAGSDVQPVTNQPIDTAWDICGPSPSVHPLSGNCYIDEFRLTIGAARYTANFTPPTGPF